VTVKTQQCPLCDGTITRAAWARRKPSSCLGVGAIAAPECWQNESKPLLAYCAQSQRHKRRRAAYRLDMDGALRALGEAIRSGLPAVQAYLRSLSPEGRYELINGVIPPLAVYLTETLAGMKGVPVRRALKAPVYPEGLVPGLREPLERFQAALVRRYEARSKNNHDPSHEYVWRTMLAPFRFAEFLQQRGIERFDVVRKRDVVAFLEEHPGTQSNHVMRFVRFLEGHKPWRDPRGRPAAGGRKPKALQPPEILLPDQIDAFLAEIQLTRTEAEYLLAWLVCKVGLTIRTAYDLSLESVQFNDAGRLVIRPADVWITLPKAIERRLDAVIEAAIPGWQTLERGAKGHLTFFRHHIPSIEWYGRDALRARARMLRASALFAAMMRGHTDRVTLHHTTGASIPYLAKIETLLSIDMHRRIAPDLVKARNDYILGDQDG